MRRHILRLAASGLLILAATAWAQTPTTPATPTVTVVAPNGGESWAVGSKETIQWKYEGPMPVEFRILLSTDSGKTYPSTLASNVGAGIREAKWTVKGNETHAALIKVVAVAGTARTTVEDASDAPFSITAGGMPQPIVTSRLTLLTPNGGEVLHEGHVDSVCWKMEGSPPTSFTLSLLPDTGAAKAPVVIATGIAGNRNCYAWTPMLDPKTPIKSARLIITAVSPQGTVADTSQASFKITPSQGADKAK